MYYLSSLSLILCTLVSQVVGQSPPGDVTLVGIKPQTGGAGHVSASVIGVSAINVNKDGVTKYAISEVQSLYVVTDASMTRTVLSTPTTVTYTLEQGASYFAADMLATTRVSGSDVTAKNQIVCKGDLGGNSADCQQIIDLKADGKSATTTVAFKGAVAPFVTITGGATPVPTAGSGRSAQLSGLLSLFVSVWTTMFLL